MKEAANVISHFLIIVKPMSSIQEEIFEKFKEVDLSKFKTTELITIAKNTLDIKCDVCHSDNVHVELKQLRSGDEAATSIYTCINCGNKWKTN